MRISYLKTEPKEEKKAGLVGAKRPRLEEESRTVAMARCDKSIQDSIVDQDSVCMEDISEDRLYQPPANRRQRLDNLYSADQGEANITESDSPMINALTKKDQNGVTRRREKSILLKDTIIYWIAYL